MCSDCSAASAGSNARKDQTALSFAELQRAIDAFLTRPMAEALRAVECSPVQPGDADRSVAHASAADVQVTHILGTPEAAYRIKAFRDVLQMRIQLNVYRLVVVYIIPLHQAQNCEALKPQFSRWEIGAEHAGWKVGWRDTVEVEDQASRSAEIYCYAMLPADFLSSSHHQLYWINDLVQMTQSMFRESNRIGLMLS